MAAERLSMRKVREIARLYLLLKLSGRAIGRSVGVSPSTMSDYLGRLRAAELSDRSTTPGCAGQQHDPRLLQPAQPIDFLNAAGVSASRGSPYRSRCVPSRSNAQAMYA